ncbi:hypothetical protein DH2020_036286 [Rehmannia glutinosa]|uniref:G-box binding protein multifunctional mosaic region domain-containing protein n=1 Tax=Rehmannia glutinosa TaxID=99300 RepID=A0ABR0V4X5_REHGL
MGSGEENGGRDFMGNGEVDKSSKEAKESNEPKTPGLQEQTSAASGAIAADWSGFQAYSPMPPPGFLVSSPQAHPYMWGVQQFIPPYGAQPHPYVAMYPHGGIYAHPAMAPGNTPGNMEVDGKSSQGKEKLPIKRSNGSLGSLNMLTGRNDEPGKTTDEPSQNGSATHSSQNGGSNTPHLIGNQTMSIVPMPAAGVVSGVPGPTTNLNIGMDYWSGAPTSAVPAMHGNVLPSTPAQAGMNPTGSRDGVQSQHWIQDEREVKRQRRKLSNRNLLADPDCVECDELSQHAEALKEENASLRAEVAHIRSAYEHLLAQNGSLKERLGELSPQEDSRCSEDDDH